MLQSKSNHSNRRVLSLIDVMLALAVVALLYQGFFKPYLQPAPSAKSKVLDVIYTNLESAALQARAYAVENVGEQAVVGSTQVNLNGHRLGLANGFPLSRTAKGSDLTIVDLIEVNPEWRICQSAECGDTNNASVRIGYVTEGPESCFIEYVQPDASNPGSGFELIRDDRGC